MLHIYESGACLGDDPEQVHKMRVATRSMRAALRLFKSVLPSSLTALADEVKWLGGILGGVRDVDVMTERVSNWRADGTAEARDALLNVLAERRATARPVLLEGLHSQRYARLMETLSMTLREPADMPPAADEAALDALPRLLARYYRRMRKLGDTLTPQSPPVEYHQLRIWVKRLRYSLEYVRPLYGTAVRRLLERATAMQQLLGNHHDAYVAGAWLHGLPANEAIGFHYGQLAQSWLDHAEALLMKFPPAYAAMRGSAWRSVRREIENKQ
jgi:CHAD domain-containing protein